MSNSTIERIHVTKSEVYRLENEIRFHEHLRRYAAIRRFCFGLTLDFPCGVGYGTFLLATNPDVTKVIGIDKSKDAIDWAKKEFLSEKTEFICKDIKDYSPSADTLVALEAIEHFEDKTWLPELAKLTGAQQVIISFPDKKSTHFNPFHLHDFSIQEVLDLFQEFLCYHDFKMGDVQFLLFVKKPANAPAHIFRNLPDLRK